jgi:hypothetical protein
MRRGGRRPGERRAWLRVEGSGIVCAAAAAAQAAQGCSVVDESLMIYADVPKWVMGDDFGMKVGGWGNVVEDKVRKCRGTWAVVVDIESRQECYVHERPTLWSPSRTGAMVASKSLPGRRPYLPYVLLGT